MYLDNYLNTLFKRRANEKTRYCKEKRHDFGDDKSLWGDSATIRTLLLSTTVGR